MKGSSSLTVLKLGGELLEDAAAMRAAAAAIAPLAAAVPLIVVHGGGRTVDAELRARGLEPRFVDGLRITDADTLSVVVSVLAGRTNTALVAALCHARCRAVGLTGADACLGLSERAPLLDSSAGGKVDLGLVGEPLIGSVTLLLDLIRLGYVPVIASIGITADGGLLNVNADTLAGHLAGVVGARRLMIAGGTAGVLDGSGRTISALSVDQVDDMIAAGEAHSGMIAKLAACRRAIDMGVAQVSIVPGRGVESFKTVTGTQISAESVTA